MLKKGKENKQFMILSVIGIIAMVTCHLAGEIYKIFYLFPFICLFVFISGYFYKEQNEEKIGSYIFYKFKKLMIPFFIINFIYGIIVNIFKYFGIIYFGDKISLYTLFIQPFINNNQYVLNFPAWFVPSIFLTSSCYLVIHKLSKKIKFLNDIILLTLFVGMHILAVYCAKFVDGNSFLITILRVIFFLPFFHIGYLYRHKWQIYDDKIPTMPYLMILIGINIFLSHIFGNLNYDMHDFSGFPKNWLFIPLIASIIGILFYTRIARILSKPLGQNKVINYISNHTYAIMMNHLFILFLLDFLLYEINLNIISIPYFDSNHFQIGWFYIYEIPNYKFLLQLGYTVLSITGSLLIQYIYDILKDKFFLVKKHFKIIKLNKAG